MSDKSPTMNVTPLSYGAVVEILDEVPTALKVIRRVRRMSQKQVAEEIGVAQATIGKIEEGGDYRTDTLRLIIRWLDSQPEAEFIRTM